MATRVIVAITVQSRVNKYISYVDLTRASSLNSFSHFTQSAFCLSGSVGNGPKCSWSAFLLIVESVSMSSLNARQPGRTLVQNTSRSFTLRGTDPLKMLTMVTRPMYGQPAPGLLAISAPRVRHASMSQTSSSPDTTPKKTTTLTAHTASSFRIFFSLQTDLHSVVLWSWLESLHPSLWCPSYALGSALGPHSTVLRGKTPRCFWHRGLAGSAPLGQRRRTSPWISPSAEDSEPCVTRDQAQYVVPRCEFNPNFLGSGQLSGHSPVLDPVCVVCSLKRVAAAREEAERPLVLLSSLPLMS